MAILGTYTQQPHEVLDYDIDFIDWIPDSDTIISASSVATVVFTASLTPPADLILGVPLIDPVTDQVVKQWVSGGTNKTTYKIQLTAVTAEGRTKEAEFKLKIKEI
jgi:hypothetical protein